MGKCIQNWNIENSGIHQTICFLKHSVLKIDATLKAVQTGREIENSMNLREYTHIFPIFNF